MPLLSTNFHPQFVLRNGHIQTVLGQCGHKAPQSHYIRKRFFTKDDDFIDLDYLQGDTSRIALLLHGLEGSSQSPYMKRMAVFLNEKGWTTVCLNYRGCSGEPNKKWKSYNSGFTTDIAEVVNFLALPVSQALPPSIFLIGFSIGGNLLLKYLGEQASSLSPQVKGAVAISVPCSIEESAVTLEKFLCRWYLQRFLSDFKEKVERRLLYHQVSQGLDFKKVKNFFDYDTLFTAPEHGYSSAYEYWRDVSSKFYLSSITCPTLLINAQNDPFYGSRSLPYEEAQESSFLFLETPTSGGHVGFVTFASLIDWRKWWILDRTQQFITSVF